MSDESHNKQKESIFRSFEINVGKDVAGIGAIVSNLINSIPKFIEWLANRPDERQRLALENVQKTADLAKYCGFSPAEIKLLMEPVLAASIEASLRRLAGAKKSVPRPDTGLPDLPSESERDRGKSQIPELVSSTGL
ncbi:MAG TPA: hypothetical protein VN643_20670 [Pyrinomonadaceae bacterium]|nr:hypothetical protein [Pyrinomonadaceae bacterium]